jgi:prephenate dehydrogenase
MSQITIVGLGLIGSSIGLGLRELGQNYTLIGHDKNRKAMDRAVKKGVVDKTHWNLIDACEKADMIILAIPINDIAPTLDAIKLDLKPGCLIMDTAPLKRPVQKAAETYLPDNVHFIGSDPVLTHTENFTVEDASARLFKDATWTLCPLETVNAEAVKVVANMVNALGATPYFLSPEEHDGLMAAAESLPLMLSGALMHAVGGSESWPEIRRMAGAQFEQVTQMPDFDAEALTETVFDNRDNIIYWIETMVAELQGWSNALENEDQEVIQNWFEIAQQKRSRWLSVRKNGDWEETIKESNVEYAGFWARMFGAGSLSRKRGKLWKE